MVEKLEKLTVIRETGKAEIECHDVMERGKNLDVGIVILERSLNLFYYLQIRMTMLAQSIFLIKYLIFIVNWNYWKSTDQSCLYFNVILIFPKLFVLR